MWGRHDPLPSCRGVGESALLTTADRSGLHRLRPTPASQSPEAERGNCNPLPFFPTQKGVGICCMPTAQGLKGQEKIYSLDLKALRAEPSSRSLLGPVSEAGDVAPLRNGKQVTIQTGDRRGWCARLREPHRGTQTRVWLGPHARSHGCVRKAAGSSV